MRAKDYLSKIRWLNIMINDHLQEVRALRDMAEKITGVTEGDRVQTSKDNDPMAETVSRIVDLETEINNEVCSFISAKKEISTTIKKVQDADLANLLHMRYIQCKKFEDIAQEMNYSYKWVNSELHPKALNEVQKIIDERDG